MAGSNLLPSAREDVIDPKSQKFTRGWLLFFEQIATRLLPLLSGDPATFLNGVGAFTSVAPKDAEYLVATANSTLTAERVTTDTATVTWDNATPAQAKANVPNDAITNAKLANMAAATIKLRAFGAGTGDPVDGTANQASAILDTATDPFLRSSAASSGITQLTSDVTAGPGSGSQAATIANDAVTNAKAANMAQSTIKGRAAAAGTGDPTDLTANQVSTVLDGATDPFLRTSAASAGTGTVTHTAGALTASAVMVGNGAADSKVLASLGTTTTVLHGNAAGLPTFGAVSLTADVSGILPAANVGGIGALLDMKFVRKTADESVTSSAALQDDDELVFAIGASQVWTVRYVIGYNAGTTGDFQFAFSVPTSATGRQMMAGVNSAATGITGSITAFSTTDLTTGNGFAGGSPSFDATMEIDLIVVNSTNAGNVTFRWAQATSNGTATILRANSFLIAHRFV